MIKLQTQLFGGNICRRTGKINNPKPSSQFKIIQNSWTWIHEKRNKCCTFGSQILSKYDRSLSHLKRNGNHAWGLEVQSEKNYFDSLTHLIGSLFSQITFSFTTKSISTFWYQPTHATNHQFEDVRSRVFSHKQKHLCLRKCQLKNIYRFVVEIELARTIHISIK